MRGPKPQTREVLCFCESPMELRHSTKWTTRGQSYYGCTWPRCDGVISCHQDSGIPLGRPADKETREWRQKAHEVFDSLWDKTRGGFMGRKQSYSWMRRKLDLKEEDAHIAMMDQATCRRLIAEVNLFKDTRRGK